MVTSHICILLMKNEWRREGRREGRRKWGKEMTEFTWGETLKFLERERSELCTWSKYSLVAFCTIFSPDFSLSLSVWHFLSLSRFWFSLSLQENEIEKTVTNRKEKKEMRESIQGRENVEGTNQTNQVERIHEKEIFVPDEQFCSRESLSLHILLLLSLSLS